MQIRVSADSLGGQDVPVGRETVASLELPAGERELLDDFLSRLQTIIRNSSSSPASGDDTRPTRRPRKRQS